MFIVVARNAPNATGHPMLRVQGPQDATVRVLGMTWSADGASCFRELDPSDFPRPGPYRITLVVNDVPSSISILQVASAVA